MRTKKIAKLDKKKLRKELASMPKYKARKGTGKGSNACLFSVRDALLKSENKLTQLIRMIIIKENVTLSDLYEMGRQCCYTEIKNPKRHRELANNAWKGLSRTSVTFNVVHEFLTRFMRKEFDITIHIKDKDGTERDYRHSELVKEFTKVLDKQNTTKKVK